MAKCEEGGSKWSYLRCFLKARIPSDPGLASSCTRMGGGGTRLSRKSVRLAGAQVCKAVGGAVAKVSKFRPFSFIASPQGDAATSEPSKATGESRMGLV